VELFAATSFGRIATRRTSETDAFSAPRMRTPRGPSRTLWSLHRIVSTSDALIVTRRHTRVEILFARSAVRSSACTSHFRAPYRGRRRVDLLVRGPGSATTVSRDDGPKPENAFRRLASSRAFTHERSAWKNRLIPPSVPAPFRLLPIRAPHVRRGYGLPPG
jgi:hypothetical protein